MKTPFLSLNASEYQTLLAGMGLPKFRGQQVVEWLFQKRVWHPDGWTNLAKPLREQLLEQLDWRLPEIRDRVDSADGSTKLLLTSRKGHPLETVVMRYEGRTSLCVSSQVGCKLACDFCQTGKLGFVRHLETDEILAQFALANQLLQPEGRRVSHVVFMGMGEPLDNFENSVKAANIMIEDFGLSARHVTLSTSGITPRIHELAGKTRAALAISLHAARDDLRTQLMPINRKYPLSMLKAAMLSYQQACGSKLTIEYILIKDKNCGIREAKELVKFLHGLRAKVNLIPFNAHPGMPYQRPDDEEIRTFQKYLAERSIPAPVRYSKGLDVSAACGQLAAKHSDGLNATPLRSRLLPLSTTMNAAASSSIVV